MCITLSPTIDFYLLTSLFTRKVNFQQQFFATAAHRPKTTCPILFFFLYINSDRKKKMSTELFIIENSLIH